MGTFRIKIFLFIWRNIFAFCFGCLRANILVQNRFYQPLEVKNTLINRRIHTSYARVYYFSFDVTHSSLSWISVYSFSPAGPKYFITVVHRNQSTQLTLLNLRRCSTISFQIFTWIWTKHSVYYYSVIHRVIYLLGQ